MQPMAKHQRVEIDLKLPEEKPEGPSDLDALVAELPTSSSVMVIQRRNDKNPSQWDHCVKISVSDFEIEGFKREFGGGVYRAYVRDTKNQLVKQLTFSIDARFLPQSFNAAPGPGAQAIALQEEAAENRKLLRDLLMALAGRPAPQSSGLDDAIKLLAVMRDGSGAGASTRDLLAMFQQGMQLAGDRPSDAFGGVVSAASPLLNAIAKNLEVQVEERRQRMLGAGPARPADAPAAGVPAGPYAWLAKVQPYFGQLVQLAKLDKDPELYADVILDQLPEEFVPELEEAAKDPAFVSEVLNRVAEARMYRGWFEPFLVRLRTQLLEEEPPAVENGNRQREGL